MDLHLPLLGRTCLSPAFAPLFVQGAEGVIAQAGPRVPWGPGEREYGVAHPPSVPTAAALQGFTHLTSVNSHSSPG